MESPFNMSGNGFPQTFGVSLRVKNVRDLQEGAIERSAVSTNVGIFTELHVHRNVSLRKTCHQRINIFQIYDVLPCYSILGRLSFS